MNRHAVVIGGGMGIGEAIARRLHADGWSVTIIDRVAALADAVANELGERAFAECADITRPEQVAEALACASKRAGAEGIGAAVNSVGVYDERRPLMSTDLAGFDRMIDVNLRGAFIFSQAVIPLMGAEAALVHIGSVNGVLAGRTLGAYKISKAGLNMLGRCLAAELAREARHIRVNVVSPGWVDTPGERKVQAALGQPDILDRPEARKYVPLERLTKASEIAAMVSLLCSEQGASVTGQVIHVDGGITNTES